MPVRHINLKQNDIDRLNRLSKALSMTQPGVVAAALRALELQEARREAELIPAAKVGGA